MESHEFSDFPPWHHGWRSLKAADVDSAKSSRWKSVCLVDGRGPLWESMETDSDQGLGKESISLMFNELPGII